MSLPLLAVTHCYLLSLFVTHCHSLSLVVSLGITCCTTCCYSLPFVVTCCTTCCQSLSLVVTRCTTRLPFYKRPCFCVFHVVVVVNFLRAKLKRHYPHVCVKPFNSSTPDVYGKAMNV